MEWQNILSVVDDISRKSKQTFRTIHFPVFLMLFCSSLMNNVHIYLLYVTL